MRTLGIFLAVVCTYFIASCEKQSPHTDALKPTHDLEGSWLAADGTVFLFRPDGTFHGYDYRNREIWGNWVSLSEERIGFQSLLHDSYYAPQYAIIDSESNERMDYIITGGTRFITAKRIPIAEAEAAIKIVVDQNIHYPNQAEQ